MSLMLAPRRLRSPQAAFALSQRPLPAHLYPQAQAQAQAERRDGRFDRPNGAANRRSVAATTAGRQSPGVGANRAMARTIDVSGAVAGAVAGGSRRVGSASPSMLGPAQSSPSMTAPSRSTVTSTVNSPRSTRSAGAVATATRTSTTTARSYGATALADPVLRPAPNGLNRAATTVPKTQDLRVVPTRPTTSRTTLRSGSRGGSRSTQPAKAARSAAWKRRLRALGALGLFCFVIVIAFSAIAMHAQLAGRQLKLTTLRVDVDAAEREHQMLRLKVAELDTPEQVVSAAYELGLEGATEVEFLPTASTSPVVAAGPVVPLLP